jgi:hypothetical protein
MFRSSTPWRDFWEAGRRGTRIFWLVAGIASPH